MSRLIDADALKKTFCAECDHTISCEDCDIDFHFEHLAPTVEAIPIEWIEAWKKANGFHSRSSSQIVNKIIKDYREEQSNEDQGSC